MASTPREGSHRGDGTDLPIELHAMRFASARAQEIAAISQALDDSSNNKLIFQRLPRHMRRRVMGQSAKRLPRNLREAHTSQLKKSQGGVVQKHKKPSRKHRRRPGNLLEEYNRRQRSKIWLETHIWHAKRFHMTERWGYRLANFPNDRSYRACYRATANHCLIQDVSFLCCIELSGPMNSLLSGLSTHTSPSSGLTFGAQALVDGSREGEIMFYESGQYPWRPVGTVSVLWKPTDPSSKSDVRSLWMWAHPAFYQYIVDALIATFKLDKVSTSNSSCPEEEGKRKAMDDEEVSDKKMKKKNGQPKKVEEVKLATRNVPYERTPQYLSACGSIQMVLLKDTLNRFRLIGPLSQAVLEEALQEVSVGIETSSSDSSPPSNVNGGLQSAAKDMCKPDVNCSLDSDSQGRESHYKFWSSIKGSASPALLPPKIVLSLEVKDPRLEIPDKRSKAVPNSEENKAVPSSPPVPYASPLWSSSVRDEVTKSKLSTAELNSLRSKLLVPGILRTSDDSGKVKKQSNLDNSVKARIPVILIQRPGSRDPSVKRLGFGCGWDIIIPAGWGMPFWLSFIFRCARPSGLREAACHELECGRTEFLTPDSAAGLEEEYRIGTELKETYFRLPPDKRPNYIKFGIACPFQCEWPGLIRDWMLPINESVNTIDQSSSTLSTKIHPSFFVLRDVAILNKINECILAIATYLRKDLSVEKSDKTLEEVVSHLPTFPNQEYSLLPVRVEALHRGVTDNMSVICVPLPEDIATIRSGGNIKELSHTDKNQTERHDLRKDHQKHLLRLRRQRVRAKKREEEDKSVSGEGEKQKQKPHAKASPTADLVSAFNKKMEKLWLPDTNAWGSIRRVGSRETAGFVTKGNFSFTEHKGCGVGYISFLSLRPMIEAWLKCSTSKPVVSKGAGVVVLVRSPKSYEYRSAYLSLILR